MPDEHKAQNDESVDQSFADILNEFENANRATTKDAAHSKRKGKRKPSGPPPLRGTVVGVSDDFILVDYGGKSEGIISSANLLDAEGKLSVKQGDVFDVTITGFNSEGMATLSRISGPRPRDWEGLTRAFEAKESIAGRVSGVVKGGLTVDVGTRAFMPSSRSGVRDAADMEKLVGQEVRVRIIKLDVD